MGKLLWSFLFVMILLSGCGWNGTPTRNNDFTPLTSITIAANSSTIAAHTSTKFTVNGNFSGLYSRDITDQVVWSSNSPTIAGFITTANPNRVTGLTPGTATLTATVGGVSSTFNLTVSSAAITRLTTTPTTPTIYKGLSKQFTASGVFSDSTTQDLTFDCTWASSTSDIATVSNTADSKGLVQTLAVGSTTITATFLDKTESTQLTVTEPVLQSITISPANPSTLTLTSVKFTAIGNYSDGSTTDITSNASWSSSKTDIAPISSDGTARALLQGTASISATLDGISRTTNLKATGGNLASISLTFAPTLTTTTLVKGTSRRITATGTFSNGVTRDITGVVNWSVSNNSSFASVTTPDGNFAMLKALAVTPASAPAVITATSGTISGTTNLIITDPSLYSLAIAQSIPDITVGTSYSIIATATFTNGTIQDVTADTDWTSSTDTVAVIGNTGIDKGRVHGVTNGTATITATYGGLPAGTAVTVRSRVLQSLTLSGTSTLPAGFQFGFSAIAGYTDGTTADVTNKTAWTIDNSNVAILADNVHQPGHVVAVDAGTATVTATFDGRSKTVAVTVQ